MRIDMNIAALRNMIANVRVMIAVVRGNALRQLHSGSRTSRHEGTFSLTRRDDSSNPTCLQAVIRWLETQGWQCISKVERCLYSPAAIKPAAVAKAHQISTQSKARLHALRNY